MTQEESNLMLLAALKVMQADCCGPGVRDAEWGTPFCDNCVAARAVIASVEGANDARKVNR